MEKTPTFILSIVIVVAMITGLGFYAYLQSRDFLRGPRLFIEAPQDGFTSTTSLITVNGRVENVAFLTLNGRQIFTDERGRFRESLLLPKSYTIMTLEGKDRFGHKAEKRLELVYRPESTTASSSPPFQGGE